MSKMIFAGLGGRAVKGDAPRYVNGGPAALDSVGNVERRARFGAPLIGAQVDVLAPRLQMQARTAQENAITIAEAARCVDV